MLEAAISQQRSILICDSSYPSVAKIAPYARDKGYDIHILAPGFPESGTCNLLDLLKDSTDAVVAHKLAIAICKIGLLGESMKESFFVQSSIQLIQAVLMFTKEFELADIMTSNVMLQSELLTEKLMAINLNPWIRIAFEHLFSTAGTKTNSAIIATTSLILSNFLATIANFRLEKKLQKLRGFIIE
jgi:type IV secretory pathway TraG/TraD family ATPase VirD4